MKISTSRFKSVITGKWELLKYDVQIRLLGFTFSLKATTLDYYKNIKLILESLVNTYQKAKISQSSNL
jgi:hypothetical protein